MRLPWSTPLVSCPGQSYARIRPTSPAGTPDRVRDTAWTTSETDPTLRRTSMLTRRAILVGALATGALLRPSTSRATASQPATPVNFDVPAGACDCHTHIHGDPARFPFF